MTNRTKNQALNLQSTLKASNLDNDHQKPEAQQNITELKCLLAEESLNVAMDLTAKLDHFLDAQSNLAHSTARRTSGATDLSEAFVSVQVEVIRLSKAVLNFIREANALDHSNINQELIYNHIADCLQHFNDYDFNPQFKMLEIMFDKSGQAHSQIFTQCEQIIKQALLHATRDLMKFQDNAVPFIIEVIASKNNDEQDAALAQLDLLVHNLTRAASIVRDEIVRCVFDMQNLIEYGAKAFMETLTLPEDQSYLNLDPQTINQDLDNQHDSCVQNEAVQVIKIGCVSIKVLKELRRCSQSKIKNEWSEINKEDLEGAFLNHHYSSTRIDNALLLLEHEGYIEIKSFEQFERDEVLVFRIKHLRKEDQVQPTQANTDPESYRYAEPDYRTCYQYEDIIRTPEKLASGSDTQGASEGRVFPQKGEGDASVVNINAEMVHGWYTKGNYREVGIFACC